MLFLSILALGGLVAGLPSLRSSGVDGLSVSLKNTTKSQWTWTDEGEEDGLVERVYSKPQLGVNFPDPSLVFTKDLFSKAAWVAYATTSNGKNVPVATSPDAWTWTLSKKDALPDPGPWSEGTPEAPDVQINDDGTFVMYYAVPHKNGSHCIGAATSKAALGPFRPQAHPLVCDDAGGGVIDPGGFDDGIQRWIYWKVDGSNLGGATTCPNGGKPGNKYIPTPIKIHRVGRDALSLQGKAQTIFDNNGKPDDGIVEAPSIVRAPLGIPGFVLFFSTHCFSSDKYDIQYAWSSTVNGKYERKGTLASTAGGAPMFGPGGLDVSPDLVNAVFHGRLHKNEGAGGSRALFSAALHFGFGEVDGINPLKSPFGKGSST